MAKQKIRAALIIDDIRSGRTDIELMDKYGMTAVALRGVFSKLVKASAITQAEIDGRIASFSETVQIDKLSITPRNYIFFTIPIYDANDIATEGVVTDISDEGLQIAGIPVAIGETKPFLIRSDEFADVFPFVFEATCRWINPRGSDDDFSAGFEITSISAGGLQELEKLIEFLTFG